MEQIVWELENGKSKLPVYITHFDLDELWTTFVYQFKYVHAAGGMVFNEQNQFLVIHRNGKWDLPNPMESATFVSLLFHQRSRIPGIFLFSNNDE